MEKDSCKSHQYLRDNLESLKNRLSDSKTLDATLVKKKLFDQIINNETLLKRDQIESLPKRLNKRDEISYFIE
ncbi:unnamed protein product, partial [Ceratitis capitata]